MSSNKINILLVEDNPGDARLIREMLRESEDVDFTVDWVPQLSDALEKLKQGGSDLVLLDLGLPDSRGLETFVRAYAQAPQVPFVVLSGLDDETLALTAVREGAQDYLVKGQTDSGMLLRAIRYATERKRIEEALRLANEELESRVAARTAELRRTNENLLQEISQRKRAEKALQMAHDTLELKVAVRTAELAKANMDLRREIEVRGAAEMAVEAERQRLYALLDALPGLVYLKAPDYSLRFANRLFRETCGEWQGKKCYEAIFKAQQPCEVCTQFRVLETGKPSVKEATYAASNRTYQVYSYPFADVDGTSLVLTLGIDITERKQAEDALRRQKAEQQIILDSVPAMIFYKDANNYFVRVNKAVSEITGLATSEIEGKSAFEIFPDQAEDYFRDDQEVISSGNPKRNIIEPQPSDRGLRWLQTDKIPYRDDRGNIIGIVGFSLDITERKQAEREVERLASFPELNPHPVLEVNGNGEIAYYNAATPKTLAELGVAGDCKLFLPQDSEVILQAIRGTESKKFYREVQINGAVFEEYIDVIPRFDVARIRAYDITARKRAEEDLRQSQARLAKAQRLAHLGNWEWDLQSGEIIWSDEVYRIFGLNPEVFTPSPEANMAYVHPEDETRVRKGFKDALAGVNPCIFVNRLVRPDGSIRYIQSQTEAVFDAGGKPRWILGTIQDITEPKVIEEKLMESEKNLRQLASQLMTAQEDERKRISQELHDELGQALLVLKLQTRSVEKELQPGQETLRAECLEMLGNIDQVVNNVRRLSHDLSPLLLEDLGLSVALERLIREFCKHYNIEYSNPETNLNNLFTLESQTTIYRIFQESLTNIGKHSQATRLTVSISRTDDRAVFLIQDNGKGFNPAQGRGQSRGMGLAAMKERVQMLGGTLSILSQEGTGTKISFDIPFSTWPQ